ncbi:MAG: LysM peptidoglycan-binding domain-containing protein [Verrucomicrobiales bacterium]|nr:LysM peptidoglycan-binding domain-containing protein [Verrucomicrobiales bacterium]MCP5556416.1 LysM peptidoglycan-binding domain-containing protein [Verrucomicrobiaceae bacterium]
MAMGLASCTGTGDGKRKGPPKNLPVISIHGSAATPPHSMSHGEYPFDANGNYVSTWAAEGERIAGRSSSAAMDYSSWKSSHGTSSSSSSSRRSTTTKKKSSSASKSTSYTIKKGDTLSGIARRYGTTVSKIKAANGLKSDLIRDGKTLRIPR